MNARLLAAIFAGCFVAVVAATLPLSAALQVLNLEARGLSYVRASGSVWDGTVHGLRWRGHELGGARLAVRPLSFLIGRIGVDFDLDGQGIVDGGGFVALKFGGLVVNGLTLTANVEELPLVLPLSGKIALDLQRADVGPTACRRAEGSVRTDALMHRPGGLAWNGPELSGPITCSGGAIVIPLKGSAGADSIAVALTLGKDGTFGIRVEARTPDAAVVSVLSAVGFVEADGVMTLTQHGRWI